LVNFLLEVIIEWVFNELVLHSDNLDYN
jgi:hypothetical protein